MIEAPLILDALWPVCNQPLSEHRRRRLQLTSYRSSVHLTSPANNWHCSPMIAQALLCHTGKPRTFPQLTPLFHNPIQAALMIEILSRNGCSVTAVHTGQKALELAQVIKFDLITLDVKLPDLDGFEVCSELKIRHFSRHTPIVFITAKMRPPVN